MPKLTDRLFFAIYPDAVSAVRIARLAQDLRMAHGLNGSPFEKEHFHVTLNFLGDFPGVPHDVVAMATKAAATVAMTPFEIAFDRVASFGGRPGGRPLVLRGGEDVAAVKLFQRALGVSLKKTGLPAKEARQCIPHLTLLYDDRNIDEQAVETIRWTVREFVLVHSLLGRSRHTPLARWQLDD
jgi:2'-5' RNA ligase